MKQFQVVFYEELGLNGNVVYIRKCIISLFLSSSLIFRRYGTPVDINVDKSGL